MSCEIWLGVRSWINAHPQEASANHLEFLDPNAAETLTRFENLGVSRADLERLGREAGQRGATTRGAERTYKMSNNRLVQILQYVRQTWDHVDGTMPVSDEDTSTRFSLGPTWAKNSCALDCVLTAAILLNAGRLQIDQLSVVASATLPLIPALVRRIVAKPWGKLPTVQRNTLRDPIRKEMNKINKKSFPMKDMMYLQSTMEEVFKGLPQASFTHVPGRVCDRGVFFAASAGIKRSTGVEVGLDSATRPVTKIEASINEDWGPRSNSDLTKRDQLDCVHDGPACKRPPRRWPIILDRLPPVLIVYTEFAPTRRKNPGYCNSLFEPFTFRHRTIAGEAEAVFEPLGFIVRKNENHFYMRWLIEGSIKEYDGLKSEKFKDKAGWMSGLGNREEFIVLFYKQRFD